MAGRGSCPFGGGAGTLEDVAAWKKQRLDEGVGWMRTGSFVALLRSVRAGSPLSRHTLRKRFRTACKVLGWER